MVKRRVKKKRRVVKRRQATVKTEPVDRRPLLGGGGSFSIIPANPFQEGVQNMMTTIQQNLNNNVNNQLNQMRTENQIMNDRLRTLQYEQQTAMERGNQLMAVNLKEQIDNYSKALDTKYGMMNQMEEWLSRAIQFGQDGKPVRKRASRKPIGLDTVEGISAEPMEPREHTDTEPDDDDVQTTTPQPAVLKVETVGNDHMGREITREVKPTTSSEGQPSTPNTTATPQPPADEETERNFRKKLKKQFDSLSPEQQQQYLSIVQNRYKRGHPSGTLRPAPMQKPPDTPK